MNIKQPPKNPDKRQVWIMAMLRMQGSSYSELARKLGVTRSCVRQAVYTRYPKMEAAIAAELGIPPEKIWPERYAARS